jgi:hypothetical protein
MFSPEIDTLTVPTTEFVGIPKPTPTFGSIEPGEIGGDPAVQAWLEGVSLLGRAW